MGLSLNGLKHAVAQPVGWATQGLGGAFGAVGVDRTGQRLVGIGKAITSPNMVLGAPQNILNAQTSKASAFVPVNRAPAPQKKVAGFPQTGNPGTNQNGLYGDTYGYSTGGSGGSGGSGGLQGASDALHSSLISDIQNKYKALNDVLNGIYGDINNVVASRTQQLMDNYNQQENDLNNAYVNTTGQTQSAYAGRGLGDSSYLSDAQSQNANIYNSNLNQLTQDKTSKLADLGQFATTNKAKYNALQNAYQPAMANLGNYDDSSLQSLDSQIQGDIGNANQSRAGLMTDQGFISQLNGITPIQQQGTQQLATRLQNLIGSAAPTKAKQYVAQGLIKASTLGDPNSTDYWNNYFNQLLGTGATPGA